MLDTASPTVVWTCIIKHWLEDDEVGTIRQEAKLKIKEEIYGFSERKHEVRWCEFLKTCQLLVKMEQKSRIFL